MSKTNKLDNRGSNVTPAGIMPPEMLKRHGLTQYNSPGDRSYTRYRKARSFKYLIQLLKGYRLQVHGVLEDHLATPLVLGTHYMVTPMAREERQDRKPAPVLKNVSETVNV